MVPGLDGESDSAARQREQRGEDGGRPPPRTGAPVCRLLKENFTPHRPAFAPSPPRPWGHVFLCPVPSTPLGTCFPQDRTAAASCHSSAPVLSWETSGFLEAVRVFGVWHGALLWRRSRNRRRKEGDGQEQVWSRSCSHPQKSSTSNRPPRPPVALTWGLGASRAHPIWESLANDFVLCALVPAPFHG